MQSKCACVGCGREWCGLSRKMTTQWWKPDQWTCEGQCSIGETICNRCTCPQCGFKGVPCNYPNCSKRWEHPERDPINREKDTINRARDEAFDHAHRIGLDWWQQTAYAKQQAWIVADQIENQRRVDNPPSARMAETHCVALARHPSAFLEGLRTCYE